MRTSRQKSNRTTSAEQEKKQKGKKYETKQDLRTKDGTDQPKAVSHKNLQPQPNHNLASGGCVPFQTRGCRPQ